MVQMEMAHASADLVSLASIVRRAEHIIIQLESATSSATLMQHATERGVALTLAGANVTSAMRAQTADAPPTFSLATLARATVYALLPVDACATSLTQVTAARLALLSGIARHPNFAPHALDMAFALLTRPTS